MGYIGLQPPLEALLLRLPLPRRVRHAAAGLARCARHALRAGFALLGAPLLLLFGLASQVVLHAGGHVVEPEAEGAAAARAAALHVPVVVLRVVCRVSKR